jgi:hypothetical protein
VAKTVQPTLTNVGQQCPLMTHQLPHQLLVNIFKGILMLRLTLGFHPDELNDYEALPT